MSPVPVTVSPDVFPIVRAALLPLGHQVANQVPNDRPATFFRVRQVGGFQANPVQHARTVAVEAWAPTPSAAGRLAEQGLAKVMGLEGTVSGDVGVYRVDLFTAPTDLPDDLTGNPRFRFTVQLFTRTLPAPPPDPIDP